MITSSSFQVILSGLWMDKWHLWMGAAAWNNICGGSVWGGFKFILYLCVEISVNHWGSSHQCWWAPRSGSSLMAINQAGRYILCFSRPLSLPRSENNTTAPTRQHREKRAPTQPKWREINKPTGFISKATTKAANVHPNSSETRWETKSQLRELYKKDPLILGRLLHDFLNKYTWHTGCNGNIYSLISRPVSAFQVPACATTMAVTEYRPSRSLLCPGY